MPIYESISPCVLNMYVSINLSIHVFRPTCTCMHLKVCISMYMYVHCISVHAYKVRKLAKIRNRYAQVPHLTKDTTWENEKKNN